MNSRSEEMTLSIVTVIVASTGLVVCLPVTTTIAVTLAGEKR